MSRLLLLTITAISCFPIYAWDGEKDCDECSEVEDVFISDSDPRLCWSLRIQPIRPGLVLTTLSIPDSKKGKSVHLNLSKLQSPHLVNNTNGMTTIAFFETEKERVNLDGVLSSDGLYRVQGAGGVFSGGRCRKRTCSFDCRDCRAALNDCRDRVDWLVCDYFFWCYEECTAGSITPTPEKSGQPN